MLLLAISDHHEELGSCMLFFFKLNYYSSRVAVPQNDITLTTPISGNKISGTRKLIIWQKIMTGKISIFVTLEHHNLHY